MTTRQPPPVLDEQAAAWIRAHVWTQAMRKYYREVPGLYTACPCQWGATSDCQAGRHDRCHRATPLRAYASMICGPDGVTSTAFLEPYEHEVDTSAAGPQPTSYALVWLADRVCRWACSCPCHTVPQPVQPTQLDLFEGAA